ncbi:MAG: nucleotidyltransferase domain-containing protein [Holophagales bacterium]|nr:nucleotidyltransferase domain-containing protein [Holophagales bacterium]
MSGAGKSMLDALQERAKELHCLYRVHEICGKVESPLDEAFHEVVAIIPVGMEHPAETFVRLAVGPAVYETPGAEKTPWVLAAPIRVQGEVVGHLEVFYRQAFPPADEGPFLKEERRLINTIAELLGQLLLQRRLASSLHRVDGVGLPLPADAGDWWVITDFLRQIDRPGYVKIARRMLNYLCWSGVEEAQRLLPRFTGSWSGPAGPEEPSDENRPMARRSMDALLKVAEEVFEIASRHMAPAEIRSSIQKWIKDSRSGFLAEALENQGSSLTDLAQALTRFQHAALNDRELSRSIQVDLRAALTRRFLTDQLQFVGVAKNFIEVSDFQELTRRIICPTGSHGKVGGKSSGLFLAVQIVRKSEEYAEALKDIRIPKTWYLTSDGVIDFIEFNHLEDLYDRKYLEIDQVRREYPHIIQVFKNSQFSPEIVKGLSVALDDFEERPIIVRSSSLLEDRAGASFSGKYKSLFLANQGTKKERLAALMDAIAEVYASIFGPDPIEYRAERGLLDVHEEMGILIQEVVGSRVGRYFLPSFAGVAFSNNEFRWSPRIRREDGLVRMVPGLGTRAVDRVGDDFPILIAPGQPGLRVNVTADEIVRYAPRRADVINLETRRFETVEMETLLREAGSSLPGIENMVSVCEDGGIHRPMMVDYEAQAKDLVVTFEGLVTGTPFVTQIRSLLRLLQEKLDGPVDLEFASDGKDLYLLQCRPQSFSEESHAAFIPRDLPPESVVFSANRFVSNGRVPEITHVVYVDPEGYAALADVESLRRVGRAVGRLNKVLPRHLFVLIGPGRWGSRGDIKLGVPVTYSDINNTSVLIEVARRKGNYVPDLSFGTHFFQDLVEASIRYLPLFPDDPGVAFNERFLLESPNILASVAPEFADLARTVRVIDVPASTGGLVLRVLMNADLDRAVGLLTPPGSADDRRSDVRGNTRGGALPSAPGEQHRWRIQVAERIGAEVDAERFGVRGMWLVGSSKDGTAGPASDLDLVLHTDDDPVRREALATWLDGWSLCLAEMNYLRTGTRAKGLLDVHFLSDSDFSRGTGWAAKVKAVKDPARPLPLRRAKSSASGAPEGRDS